VLISVSYGYSLLSSHSRHCPDRNAHVRAHGLIQTVPDAHSDDEDTPEALREALLISHRGTVHRSSYSVSSLSSWPHSNNNGSLKSTSASSSDCRRYSPSISPREIPPSLPPDGIPKGPPPAYSMTPDITNLSEEITLQVPWGPFQCAPELLVESLQLHPYAPPGPSSPFFKHPLSQLWDFTLGFLLS
jgi:hypothetical protein